MKDLTILYITANQMPQKWVDFQLYHLMEAIGDTPIVSVSRKPMNLGLNLIDTEPKSYWNIFMQQRRAAIEAKTPYVAMVEDDTLYTKEHFTEFRPPMDAVSYDRSRWSLFTWSNMYCLRQRISNCSFIGPRKLTIEAFSEWREKWPNEPPANEIVGEIGRPVVERRLHVSPRKMVEWYCTNPIVQLNHPTGSDVGHHRRADGKFMVKKHGQIKAYDIPHWGKATDIIKIYHGQ